VTDPSRTYSAEEEARLAQNLLALHQAIDAGELRSLPPTVETLDHFHRVLFHNVRNHAGQHRREGYGQEWLTFGPNRSLRRDKVPESLKAIFSQLQRSMRSLEENQSDPEYEPSAIHIAVWAHAEVIRVHPYEDGNGRSSRALMNWILVTAGLRPIAIEAPRQEYIACLNHYFERGEIEPLVDLALRLYP
jgi:fido (protein-threonine AMPylation protein)